MSKALPRSATAVALLANIPSTGHVGEVRAQRFAMHGDGIGERSAAFVAFAREQIRADRKVVALYPTWQSQDAQRAVNFARGATLSDHITGIGVDLSPLALSLIADQLAYLAPYLPPGMLAALSDELPRHLLAGAWLRSVSGLTTIPTSMRQNMGSYAPSVSFLAYCAPTRHVERMRPHEVTRTLPFRPVQPVQLLCSAPDPTVTGLFDDHVPQAIQPVATRSLPTQPLGPVYWGTNKYVEFVALSAHPQALAYAASSLRVSTCAWCNEPLAAKPCPFCASNATRTTPSRPATPHPAPTPSGPSPSAKTPRPAAPGARPGGHRGPDSPSSPFNTRATSSAPSTTNGHPPPNINGRVLPTGNGAAPPPPATPTPERANRPTPNGAGPFKKEPHPPRVPPAPQESRISGRIPTTDPYDPPEPEKLPSPQGPPYPGRAPAPEAPGTH